MQAIKQEMAKNSKAMLRAHYNAPDRTLTATELARAMKYSNYKAANMQYGKLGFLIAEELGVKLVHGVTSLVKFVPPGEEGNPHWLWIMWPPVAEALERLGWLAEEG